MHYGDVRDCYSGVRYFVGVGCLPYSPMPTYRVPSCSMANYKNSLSKIRKSRCNIPGTLDFIPQKPHEDTLYRGDDDILWHFTNNDWTVVLDEVELRDRLQKDRNVPPPINMRGLSKDDISSGIDVTQIGGDPGCDHPRKYVNRVLKTPYWVCPDCKADLGDA